MEGRTDFHPSRDLEFTKVVYGGTGADRRELGRITAAFDPPESDYRICFGEIHGHTELSDGQGTLDAYFRAARDLARLDFCAITDHDHGGVGRPELWGDKWELTRAKVAEYHDPGTFVTLLGYERDSFPFYPNMCLYYRDDRGEIVRSMQDGEITADELKALAARDDVLFIPHQISQIEVGVNWRAIRPDLMPRVAEIYSKWGASEFMGNPRPIRTCARGNFWQDALETGARIGCIAGSDVHTPFPGLRVHSGGNLRQDHPGIAAVLVRELTREAVFDAMRERRCYACEGTRTRLDFRVNGAVMGSEIRDGDTQPRRTIFLNVTDTVPLETITIVKNGEDRFAYNIDGGSAAHRALVVDLEACRPTDYYYLRVTRSDGLRAWSSPVWVDRF